MVIIKFNPQQTEFIERVANVINSDEKQTGMLLLKAPAGTGKTFCCIQLKKRFGKNISILAPTNKACTIFPPRTCSTIHKFLGSEMSYTDNGSIGFDFPVDVVTRMAEKLTIKVLIVDECSMITEKMFSMFDIVAKHVYIVFTGDCKQIPPINESQSIIFHSNIDEISFDTSMRTRDSIVAKYNKQFRDKIDGVAMDDVVVDACLHENACIDFKNKIDTVILAWTNNCVDEWNNLVRTTLFYKEDEEMEDYYQGEKLVFSGCRKVMRNSTNGYSIYVNRILENFPVSTDKDTSHIYHSNDTLTICEIDDVEVYIPYEKCHHSPEDKVIKCTDCGIKSGHRTNGYSLEFYEIIDENGVYWHICKNGTELTKILKHMKDNVLMVPFNRRKKEWVNYYALQNTLCPDLNYSYASTVHKSQGSQWDNVYVDIENIRRCRSDGDRLAYTACSRAVKNVFFL